MERPILFSTPMVQAILDGRKTQTRRIVKYPKQYKLNELLEWVIKPHKDSPDSYSFWYDSHYTLPTFKCPYGKVGDVLWVKESYYAYGMWLKNGHTKSGKQKWRFSDTTRTGYKYHYAENPPENVQPNTVREKYGWFKRPSLFMPKHASRIKLPVIHARAERLEDISNPDAIAEGIKFSDSPIGFCGYDYLSGGYNFMTTPKKSFMSLWRSVRHIERFGDTGNPWVWVIEFKKL